jgi:hypothetical protein
LAWCFPCTRLFPPRWKISSNAIPAATDYRVICIRYSSDPILEFAHRCSGVWQTGFVRPPSPIWGRPDSWTVCPQSPFLRKASQLHSPLRTFFRSSARNRISSVINTVSASSHSVFLHPALDTPA